MAFGLDSIGRGTAAKNMMQAYEPKATRGGADWAKILKMLPQASSGMMPKSQRKRRLGGKDVSRTRMNGLYGMMGIAPWG